MVCTLLLSSRDGVFIQPAAAGERARISLITPAWPRLRRRIGSRHRLHDRHGAQPAQLPEAPPSILAVPLEPWSLRAEFRVRTWRAADGSLLQGFAARRFAADARQLPRPHLAPPNCSDADRGLQLSDGSKRKMSVQDL